jgi:hypothetical protein
MVFGDANKAVSLLEESIRLCNKTDSFMKLAQISGAAGDFKQALKWATKRTEAFPTDEVARQMVEQAGAMLKREL